MKKIIIIIAFFSNSILAAPMLNINAEGQITSVRGVEVLGLSYKVEFVDGSCAENFTGCDEPTDFPIADQTLAHAAGQALFDQVLLDSPLGDFDTNPALTFGCDSVRECAIFIPFDVVFTLAGFPVFQSVQAANRGPTSNLNDSVGRPIGQGAGIDYSPRTDTTADDFFTFARFTRIPEPSTYSLFALGLLLTLLFRQIKARSHRRLSSSL